MRKIRELLAEVPPSYSLNHYRQVFDTLFFIEQHTNSELFTIEDIKMLLRKPPENPLLQNPLLRSISERAEARCEDVLGDFIDKGIVIRTSEGLKKTEDYDGIRRLLKLFASSNKRLVLWCVYYLWHKNMKRFGVEDVQRLIDYDEASIAQELQNQLKWKNKGDDPLKGKFVKILSWTANRFTIKEPPRARRKGRFLVDDCNSRVSAAILNLHSAKREFLLLDVLAVIDRLERLYIEKALKKLEVTREGDQWVIDEDAEEAFEREILIATYPVYGIAYIKGNPFFKVASRKLYIDAPNYAFGEFIGEVQRITAEHKNDVKEAYKLTKEAETAFNKNFASYLRQLTKISEKGYSSWFKVSIARNVFGIKPYLIKTRINWNEFLKFQQQIADNMDIRLLDKYEYLLDCRIWARYFDRAPEKERIQRDVRNAVSKELDLIVQEFDTLQGRLASIKKLYRLSERNDFEFITLEFVPEMLNILGALKLLAENGAITSCYREMRKLLENLSLVLIDDLLLRNMAIWGTSPKQFASPYRNVNRKWFEWARGGWILRVKRQLLEPVTSLVDGASSDKAIRRSLVNTIIKNLTYPLILVLTARNEFAPTPAYVPTYETNSILTYAQTNLRQILEANAFEEGVIEKLNEGMQNKVRTIKNLVPMYPLNECILQLIDDMINSRLERLYNEYSLFVHSYFTSWQIFPYSSILEFKIFLCELRRFSKAVLEALDSLVKR